MVEVIRYTEEYLSEVVGLVVRQEERFHVADGRIRVPHSAEEIARQMEGYLGNSEASVAGVVVLDGGAVKGFAVVDVQISAPDSLQASFATPIEGMARLLTLCEPADPVAPAVVDALFDGLMSYWSDAGALGANFAWPSHVEWPASMLDPHVWHPISSIALRPPGAMSASKVRPELLFREARQDEEDIVVALHVESIEYHAEHDPTVRVVPGTESGFRDWIRLVWAEQGVGNVEELLRKRAFVVEHEGAIAAMITSYGYHVAPDQPGVFPAGVYCHIGSTAVRDGFRGRGVGQALVKGVLDFYEPYSVLGYTLWYHLRNPLSSTFWPRLGWEPILTRYMWRPGVLG